MKQAWMTGLSRSLGCIWRREKRRLKVLASLCMKGNGLWHWLQMEWMENNNGWMPRKGSRSHSTLSSWFFSLPSLISPLLVTTFQPDKQGLCSPRSPNIFVRHSSGATSNCLLPKQCYLSGVHKVAAVIPKKLNVLVKCVINKGAVREIYEVI